MSDYAVYCVRTHRFIAFAHDRAAAETALTGYDADYGPNLVALPTAEAEACQRAAHRSPVVEITADRFHERFELLPPVGHRDTGEEESFKCPEEIVHGIVDIFVRIGGRYYTFADSDTFSHAECYARVLESSAFLGQTAPEVRER